MKTRTAPALALFVVIVALIGFGAYQGYRALATPATTTTVPLSLEEACGAYHDGLFQNLVQVFGEPPVGWVEQETATCVDMAGTFSYDRWGMSVDVTGVVTYCDGWSLGQSKAVEAATNVGKAPAPIAPCPVG